MQKHHLYWIIGAIVLYWLYTQQPTTSAGNSTTAVIPITN